MIADAPPPVVDRPALFDLRDLGQRKPVVLDHEHPLSEPIRFRIPRSAHRRWPYARVFVRFRIELDPEAAPGYGYVEMLTGLGPSASAEFVTSRKRGRLVTHWNTVNVHGSKAYRTTDLTIPVRMDNYMLEHDRQPGTHALRFELEAYRGFRVRRVVISPRSGLRLTATPSSRAGSGNTTPSPPDEDTASDAPPPRRSQVARESGGGDGSSGLLWLLLGLPVAGVAVAYRLRRSHHDDP